MRGAPAKPSVSSRKRPRTASPARARSRASARGPGSSSPGAAGAHWTFLSNHAHVLVLLPRSPSLVLREVAEKVGITERAVQRIIADLEAGGIIVRERMGRQNRYRIRAEKSLRHPLESHRTVGDLLALINDA